MDVTEQSRLFSVLQGQRATIADIWYHAIKRTDYASLSGAEVQAHLSTLVDQAITLLLSEPFERQRAQAIGAALVHFHYIQAETLSRTQEVLAYHLTAGLSAEEIIMLQPRLAALLGEVASGFFNQACAAILAKQEQIRVIDISERIQVEAELTETKRQLAESQEVERLHLARELHDGPVQELYGVYLQLGILMESLSDEVNSARLAVAQTTLRRAIETLRGICTELRPPILAASGLKMAIRSHAQLLQAEHQGLKVHLDLSYDSRVLPEDVQIALFRIYQQAVGNVLRHAQARHVWVRLVWDAQQIVLEIQDDGRGFTIPERWIDLARQGHLGLLGTAEQVAILNGRLEIRSILGKGTVVQVIIPQLAGG